jgi:hypothetical protein
MEDKRTSQNRLRRLTNFIAVFSFKAQTHISTLVVLIPWMEEA